MSSGLCARGRPRRVVMSGGGAAVVAGRGYAVGARVVAGGVRARAWLWRRHESLQRDERCADSQGGTPLVLEDV